MTWKLSLFGYFFYRSEKDIFRYFYMFSCWIQQVLILSYPRYQNPSVIPTLYRMVFEGFLMSNAHRGKRQVPKPMTRHTHTPWGNL